MERMIIYTLSDPLSGNVRYVGKSVNGLKRARSHMYPKSLEKNRTRCGNWLRFLKKNGQTPLMEEVEVYENHEKLLEAEIFYIAYFRSLGFDLTNLTTGGEGAPGRKKTPEEINKIRAANLGNTNALGKKQNLTEEQRENLRVRAKDRVQNPEVKAKISKALTGRKQPMEVVAKRGESLSAGGKLNKPVIDLNTGVAYRSSKDVALCLGIGRHTVCNILKARKHPEYPIKLRYLEKQDGIQDLKSYGGETVVPYKIPKWFKRLLAENSRKANLGNTRSLGKSYNNRPVVDSDGKRYPSVKIAARENGISVSQISRALKSGSVVQKIDKTFKKVEK